MPATISSLVLIPSPSSSIMRRGTAQEDSRTMHLVLAVGASLAVLIAVQIALATLFGWTTRRYVFVSAFGLTDTGLCVMPCVVALLYWLLGRVVHDKTTQGMTRRRDRFIALGRHRP
ncbi:Aste57867_14555 [Aphanomyces stellatus]|uniref:Aste57867_14555 protein n=1 Tax=Aphanomyces stellatus TaxID=120398 RepID=A0A485L1A5_9STRA|nr:hypothetical protein As57867_014501 [Aphanomyces stellatus]VFT91375.1 Aste57867_14555 [Aphanomyces stellatus]